MASTVDPDDARTWPEAVRAYVDSWAERLAGTTEYPEDLAIPLEDGERFLGFLEGRPVRAYHCTRLLDAEVDDVRERGLAALDEELVVRKITSAHAAGALTEAECDYLSQHHLYAVGNTTGRPGKVCVLIGRIALDEDGGLDRLLTLWGGEAIFWGHDRTPMAERLKELGRPTVVAMDLDFSGRSGVLFLPPLPRLFVAKVLGLSQAYGEAHIPGPIIGAEVVGIWQPGDPEYDGHARLPMA